MPKRPHWYIKCTTVERPAMGTFISAADTDPDFVGLVSAYRASQCRIHIFDIKICKIFAANSYFQVTQIVVDKTDILP
jgi:hypothetical protein